MPNNDKKVSDAVIKRLPRYFRIFKLLQDKGRESISSSKIAEYMGVTASQVRQDFCSFGGFGQQGYGYDVAKMTEEIARILGLNRHYDMIIIGAGNIGSALANYNRFKDEGFEVKALFDLNVTKGNINGLPLFAAAELEEYIAKNNVDIAVIAVQRINAEEVLNRLSAAGVKNIWNFAPVELKGTDDIIIENINMSDSLYVLSYKLNRK
ncbi:MAG: redox-sensing transcriptional repressor Rex [Clostridiales bacterium]|nr:redox-sensing transcriptional repressor Rex [Clostridiales bacterium]